MTDSAILATLTFQGFSANLSSHGFWYPVRDNEPSKLLATTLNTPRSPHDRYSPADGGPATYYQNVAREQAKKMGATIELAKLPERDQGPLDPILEVVM